MTQEEAPDPLEIVCVKTEHPHRHNLSVGLGSLNGPPTEMLTVAQIREALDSGRIFYT
jgi:hypothetical protein